MNRSTARAVALCGALFGLTLAIASASGASSGGEPHEHRSHAHGEQTSGPAAAEPPTDDLPKPLAWLGRFHPPATHFPIALLIAAALAELSLMRGGQAHFEHSVRFTLWLGALGAILAAILGWLFAGFRLVDDEWLTTAHRWAGTATALWALGLLHLHRALDGGSAGSRSRFRLALFLGAGLVGATGFLGGSLVHGLDHYAWWETR